MPITLAFTGVINKTGTWSTINGQIWCSHSSPLHLRTSIAKKKKQRSDHRKVAYILQPEAENRGHFKKTKNSHNLFSGFARKARGRSKDDATGDAYLYAYDTNGIAIAS